MIHASIPGRIGRDADLRHTQNGTAVANFPVATDHGWGDNKTTQWVECAVFGKRAEALTQYLTKGTPLTVIGQLHLEEFTRQDGTHGAKNKLNVSEVELQGGGQQGGGNQPAQAPRQPAQPPAQGGSFDDMEDDIPF
jgi:single-strand DNA-binding protein